MYGLRRSPTPRFARSAQTIMGDPLSRLDDDYASAVVHAIWNCERQANGTTLLLGAVELLPHEVPPPVMRKARSVSLGKRHTIRYVERTLTAREGVAWFESAKSGQIEIPAWKGSGRPSDQVRCAGPLDEEPASPLLLTTDTAVPFSPRWQTTPRVRHLIAATFGPEQIWANSDLLKARDWIEEETGVDLELFPEYWGSLHLIAPNPIFRHFHSRLDRSTGQPEFVLFAELRTGKDVAGLTYELESQHATGLAYRVQAKLKRNGERLRLPGEPELLTERVWDQERGLLHEVQNFLPEWGVSVTINSSTETRQVAVERSDGTTERYNVALAGPLGTSFQAGAPREPGAAARRLSEAKQRRTQRNRGLADQKWFRAQAADAAAELRALVGPAAQEVLVVDPYFTGEDLLRFLMAIQNPSVPVRVLVGGHHLERPTRDGVEHGDVLARRITEARDPGRMNPLRIRVMRGATPAIHDRFLLVGDELRLLGSSLNSFGDRGTMILRVPDPQPVLIDIEKVWSEAADFENWLEARKKSRGGR